MKEIILKRIVVYPKDVMVLTGRKERTAREFLTKLKKKIGKGSRDYLTIDEFCELSNFNVEHVIECLRERY